MHLKLMEIIKNKKARICIIGLGYVGLPIALEFVKKGYFVYGLDNSKERVDSLNNGNSYITDISSKEIKTALRSRRFSPTQQQSILGKSDVIIICVPTPLRKRKVPNVSYIIKATHTIAKYLRRNQLIILESTTYPGTTRDVVMPVLEKSGLREGKDFFLAFSPERIDPGNKRYTFAKIPKIIGGISKEAGKLTKIIYSKVINKVIPVSSAETAEVVKLLENTFRIVNIGLINEFAMLCDKLKIDVWEVVEAAKTKPFGFMPFYPGPGIGGHCLDGREYIFVQNGDGVNTTDIASFVDKLAKNPSCIKKHINGVLYIKPPSDYKMLTFDVAATAAQFKNIGMLSKRYTRNKLYEIITNDNRKVRVTDLHPMLVWSEDRLAVKLAKDLNIGDEIPFVSAMEYERLRPNDDRLCIDLIEKLKDNPKLAAKIRVKPRNFTWREHKDIIYKLHFDNEYYHDYIRYNALPLKYYLELESRKLLSIKHSELLLATGRGPSYQAMSAVIKIDSNFCRLIGYYLSEGCITQDESIRTRFSFNRDEREYIDDVCSILTTMGMEYSIYQSKQWNSSCIKVSSEIFGILLRDILKCGSDCYDMSIPNEFFTMPKAYKWELLKGLLRGDGGVDVKFGKRTYFKKDRQYCHYCNSCGVNYFSSSKKLFQQVILTLQEFGIHPALKKREGLLYIFGQRQILKLKDVFLGKKRAKIESYFNNSSRVVKNRGFRKHKNFITSAIKRIVKSSGANVYSAETEDTHTIVTSYGTIIHNCIPIDPIYLSWKARKVGFKTEMIDLASKTNLFMPHYVVHRAEVLLKAKNKGISKAKILILGVTYKKDVKDLRESPALDIIELLQNKKAYVSYADPYIPYLNINSIKLTSAKSSPSIIRENDLVILITDHRKFNYKAIARNARLILDTRNAFGARNIKGKHIIKL